MDLRTKLSVIVSVEESSAMKKERVMRVRELNPWQIF